MELTRDLKKRYTHHVGSGKQGMGPFLAIEAENNINICSAFIAKNQAVRSQLEPA